MLLTEFDKPYYAVIFTSERTEADEGYAQMNEKMNKLAAKQPGFIGFESARETIGISVSYWSDLDSLKQWKKNSEHMLAQKKGREVWYKYYKVRVCRVEQEYDFAVE